MHHNVSVALPQVGGLEHVHVGVGDDEVFEGHDDSPCARARLDGLSEARAAILSRGSRISWENLLLRAMTPSSRGMEPPADPERLEFRS